MRSTRGDAPDSDLRRMGAARDTWSLPATRTAVRQSKELCEPRAWWDAVSGVGSAGWPRSWPTSLVGEHGGSSLLQPFLLNRKTTSDLRWAFNLIDGGRIKEYADEGADNTPSTGTNSPPALRGLAGAGEPPAAGLCPSGRGHDACSAAQPSPPGSWDHWRDRTARGSGSLE